MASLPLFITLAAHSGIQHNGLVYASPFPGEALGQVHLPISELPDRLPGAAGGWFTLASCVTVESTHDRIGCIEAVYRQVNPAIVATARFMSGLAHAFD